MKQLIILLLLPAFAFSQYRRDIHRVDTTREKWKFILETNVEISKPSTRYIDSMPYKWSSVPSVIDTGRNWYSREPDYKPGHIYGKGREETLPAAPVRLAMMSEWFADYYDERSAHYHYCIKANDRYLFSAECFKDTLRIDPSLFDSTAVKAKVIIVAGKLFELKNNK